jgi:hypothetical protein
MINKNLAAVIILGLLFTFVPTINAQEKPIETKEMKMMMQDEDMQKCMDKIAADSTMRMHMMDKMMGQCKGNKEAMMQMCKKMMDNPEMQTMMKKKMQSEGMMEGQMMKHKMMMSDSTKTIEKPDSDSLHHK